MSAPKSNTARNLVWAAVVALVVLHEDFWFRDAYEPLVFGFLPIGLAYHTALSVVASVVWFLATKHCFPVGEEKGGSSSAESESGHSN